MGRIQLIFGFVIILVSVTFSQHPYIQIHNSEDFIEEGNEVQDQSTISAGYQRPTYLYPVYLSIVKDINDTYTYRDNLRITLGTTKRRKRSRPFTRFNSTPTDSSSRGGPTAAVKKVKRKSKPLLPEPLIMIRNLTNLTVLLKLSTNANGDILMSDDDTATTIKPVMPIRNLTKPTVQLKLSTTDNGDILLNDDDDANTTIKPSTTMKVKPSTTKQKNKKITTTTSKPAKKPQPDPPPPPPTGDVTEEEEDEEEEEEDDEQEIIQADNDSEDSSEEHEEDDENSNPKLTKSKQSQTKQKKSQAGLVTPTKGDSGSTEVQSDNSVKKKKKKAKKKKKGKKKAQLYFIPAPLGPKADFMVRLDQVNKNVREIFSVVKGVFTDYVVQRPPLNIEFALKGEKYPHENEEHEERADFFDSDESVRPPPPSWNPPSWRRKYPNPSSISKRVLGNSECTDDEDCDFNPSPTPPKKRPYTVQRIPMPYPIYMESRDDDSREYNPFYGLPPLSPSYFNSGREKTWVKTWDKKKNGLPKIADSFEASKRVKHRPSEVEEDDY